MTRVLLHVEAATRGFKSPLAFRRWCRGHKVPVLKDGKRLWVKPLDIDGALDRLSVLLGATPCANETRVDRAFERLVSGG